MKIPCLLYLSVLLFACTSCEKDEPTEYPVTMRLNRVIPISDYQFFVGGHKIDNPQAMARFRDIGIPYEEYGVPGVQYLRWAEPDGAQFDRIDFPDADHFRILWTKGGETICNIRQEDGIMKLQNQEQIMFYWVDLYLQDMLRYQIDLYETSPILGGMIGDECYWGRFTSDRRFEMLWVQVRWRTHSKNPSWKDKDELLTFSNTLDESKIGVMGPDDSLVVRHYKVIFSR